MEQDGAPDTPPFGVGPSAGRAGTAGAATPAQIAEPFEIRDRLIQLDDLRKRGIISEEEFAAKKSELLDRI